MGLLKRKKPAYSLLMNVVECKTCGEKVHTFDKLGEEHRYKQNICKCADAMSPRFTTKAVCVGKAMELKLARIQCEMCAHNTFEVIPAIIEPPSMVKAHCAYCMGETFHYIISRPCSLLDTLLEERAQEAII